MRKTQIGFSTIEVLLMLVIIGVIGGTGWYVRQAKNDTDKTLRVDNSSTPDFKKKTSISKPESPVFAALPSGWTEYKSDENGFRLGYPNEWGALSGTPLTAKDYRDDTKNMQGRLVINISSKQNFSVVARKYGATIEPSADGKTWVVSEENPAAADGYKVGDTYTAKEINVNGGKIINLSFVDEECTYTQWLVPLKNAYAVVAIPELCPIADSSANLQPISDTNKAAYDKLTSNLINSITIY